MRHFYTIILLFCLSFLKANVTNPQPSFNLRTCDKVKPAGTQQLPFFGWHNSNANDNEIQTGYQLIVASSPEMLALEKGDIWDSGKTISRMQNYIDYNGKPLSPATRYFWKVRIWDKSGNISRYSAATYFDTGLFSAEDWKGSSWIMRNSKEPNIYTYFRKQIQLSNKTVKKAIVYLSAFHNYELYLNGKAIGKGLAYHYPQFAYYNSYDVTTLLHGNSNNISAMTHWYGGGQGRPKGDNRFLLKLTVTYTDGTTDVFGTDKTWKQSAVSAFNPNTMQRNGEGVGFVDIIDSRRAITDWNRPDFDDTAWQNAIEIDPNTDRLRPDLTQLKERKIKPVSVISLGNDRYVIDLGKIYAGVPEISFSGGMPGDTIKMWAGFILNEDGTVSEKINQHTDLSYFFVLNGNKCVFKPVVYLGYRYLQVNHSPIKLTTNNVGFIQRFYELEPERSHFSSSNPMLNTVWKLMTHSLTLGAQEGFVDTPTREKGEFLGDGWSQGVAAMKVMGDRALNHRMLLQFLDSQDQYWPDGRLNAVYPNGDGKRDIPDFTQQYLLWAWDYYMETGNLEFLKTNYLKLKKVAAYVDSYTNPATGLIHNLAGGSGAYRYGIIDWPESMRYGYDMSTDARTVINAYAYADFDIISKIAAIINNKADADSFRSKATLIREAINRKLVNADGIYVDGLLSDGSQSKHVSQHANMFPIAMNIVNDSNRKAVITAVKERKMSVGMVTVRFLPQALGLVEEGLHLLDLYTNPAWDGWAKTVSKGGTATWECWDALELNQSLCHPWGTSGLDGIQQFILGVRSIKPQHELIQIKPLDFQGKLANVSGTVPTDKGDIQVTWKIKSKTYQLKLLSPNNVTAEVYIPKGNSSSNEVKVNGKTVTAKPIGNYLLIENIGSGKHVFERRF
ncbi:family 78 glycoside hydrolase catalytic domain [Flavobacterium sp. ZS1P14]|uniref:family 78 glycoside hydrolase catalytic domain n=1 Tax=Flavobacterium sp. ZS1P14 TaxID=3401729 RepID=UPI003AAB1B5A